MNPEFDPSLGFEVIFDDKKCFSNSYEAEVLIIKHKDYNCIEILAYDPVLKKESNRLYVNSRKVRAKLNRKDVEEMSSEFSPDYMNQDEYLEHLNYITSELSVEFLLSRLHCDRKALSDSRCVIFLSSNEIGQEDPILSTLACDIPAFQYVLKPDGLVSYSIPRSEEREGADAQEDPDSSAEDSFNGDSNSFSHSRPTMNSPNEVNQSELPSLSQKTSFSCCNDINIIWEEKPSTGGIISIHELIGETKEADNETINHEDNVVEINNNTVKSPKGKDKEPDKGPPARRRSSFDSAVHNIAARVLAPLFADHQDDAKCNKLDAGVTPKRRSTFSMFHTLRAKPMHGENYHKTSMKLEPLERQPSMLPKTPEKVTNTSHFSSSSTTIPNSRSGSESTVLLPGLSPMSGKGSHSPLTPVVGRKAMKKISHHNIKNYLT